MFGLGSDLPLAQPPPTFDVGATHPDPYIHYPQNEYAVFSHQRSEAGPSFLRYLATPYLRHFT